MLGRLTMGLMMVPGLIAFGGVLPDQRLTDLHNIYNLENMPARLKASAPAYRFRNKADLHAYIVKVARAFTLPPKLLKRIVAVESANCKFRRNTKTRDFGCFQLNDITIQLYAWNKHSVVHNDMLNVYAAAVILSDFRKAFPNDYQCRYNIGFRKLPRTCKQYLQKLAAVQL